MNWISGLIFKGTVIGLAAALLPAATGSLGSVLTIERAGQRTSVPVIERNGERLVPLVMGMKAALGDTVRIETRLPYVTLSRDGRSLKLAAGLNPALRQGRSAVWLPDPVRLVGGLPSVTPRSLVRVLAELGVTSSWVVPHKHLKLLRTATNTSAAKPFHIVLDPGHGGADCGARGRSRMCEKSVTLDLALRIARQLRSKGIKVTMTRERDTYVSLQKRVHITRAAKADLFVSIHVNSARDRSARGIETYVYGHRALRSAHAATVRRENAEAPYLEIILSDLEQRQYHNASVRVAGAIEESMVRRLNLIGRAEKRVFEAPFYVLAQAQRPAVLVEVGFISNSREEKKLRSTRYRQQLAESITAGLLAARTAT